MSRRNRRLEDTTHDVTVRLEQSTRDRLELVERSWRLRAAPKRGLTVTFSFGADTDRVAAVMKQAEQGMKQAGQAMVNALLSLTLVKYGTDEDFEVDERLHVGYVTGWRHWVIAPDSEPGQPRLVSVFQRRADPWEPGRAKTAACRVHDAPEANCGCGIYATKDAPTPPTPYARKIMRGDVVIGRVALWGRIVEHEFGYRAEHAYPLSLALGPSMLGLDVGQALAREYRVELEPVS